MSVSNFGHMGGADDALTLLFRRLQAIHAVLTHLLFAESSPALSFFLLLGRALGRCCDWSD